MMCKMQTVIMATLLLAVFSRCTKLEFGKDYKVYTENDNSSIMFTDLQITPFITDYMEADRDLLELFGEENIHFGDMPPLICTEGSDFQFKADNGIYATAKSNIGGNWYNLPTQGSIQPIDYFHCFHHQDQNIIQYICKTKDGGTEHLRFVDTVFLMGHDNCFTAYYYEIAESPGRPKNAIVISGKKSDNGVTDYRYGVKIIEYTSSDYDPTTVFGAGSIHIFKEKDNLAETFHWYDGRNQSPGTLP